MDLVALNRRCCSSTNSGLTRPLLFIHKAALAVAPIACGRTPAEVNRLWELNKDRIGTGDPDLLPVSTELRL
jgi:hypothetical protein